MNISDINIQGKDQMCPKCGQYSDQLTFCPGHKNTEYIKSTFELQKAKGFTYSCKDLETEHLHITCKGCRFVWGWQPVEPEAIDDNARRDMSNSDKRKVAGVVSVVQIKVGTLPEAKHTLKWGEDLPPHIRQALKDGETAILNDADGKPYSHVIMDSYGTIREKRIFFDEETP